MKKSTQLREMLGSGETQVMPDAYDPISARIIERAGFKAVQCSGYSMSIAACHGCEADLTLEENLQMTGKIAGSVGVPVMADGEDGYGGPETVGSTVQKFMETGAAGMNIEDLIPSRTGECRIVEPELMVEKIRSAREAAAACGNPDFIINARTDALRAFEVRFDGVKEAIKRANRYLEAGADLAFVCYTATMDEARELVRGIDGPISIAAGQPYNIREFTIEDLRRLRVARVSLPTLAILSAIRGLFESISLVMEPGGFGRITESGLCCSQNELAELLRRNHSA